VVNDSIVLIDFINHRVRAGHPLREALREAGCLRFRPVLLTSVTTIGGLLPLLLEKSFQAQFLVPMATSMAFGLASTTVLVLILVPVMYSFFGTSARDGHVESEPGPPAAGTIVDEEVSDQDWLPADLQQHQPHPQPLSA